jgi:nucleotide-binding universal stress UspA family protein
MKNCMYQTILVTLDTTPTDRAIIEHVKKLAGCVGSRVVLLHVAAGAAAKWLGPDAGGEEVEKSQNYLNQVKAEFETAGVPADTQLACGEPATEIIKWVEANGCDLVAMSTHGHRWLGDLVYGTTAIDVQHRLSVPVLLLRAK